MMTIQKERKKVVFRNECLWLRLEIILSFSQLIYNTSKEPWIIFDFAAIIIQALFIQ